ncbi:MAG TPA: hypothetical protein PLI18_06030 [Pirellulaceae bacterium]|nr:hypothetical protein [Pirellulaceae bacterium]
MSLRLEVSLNRKLGEPNFGSRGAGLSLSVDAETSLIDRPDALRARIAALYAEVRRAVDRELHRDEPIGPRTSDDAEGLLEPEAAAGHLSVGHDRPASDEQMRAIFAIGRRSGRNLYRLCRERFGKAQPRELSFEEAGRLLDELDRRTAQPA